jgi:hypothetical protein
MAVLSKSRTMPVWQADEGAQAPAAVFTAGPINLGKFLNGRIAGNVFSDAAGTLECLQELTPGSGGLLFTIPVDATVPAFAYPFTIQIFSPYVTMIWTQGGAPSTFLRATVAALPQ